MVQFAIHETIEYLGRIGYSVSRVAFEIQLLTYRSQARRFEPFERDSCRRHKRKRLHMRVCGFHLAFDSSSPEDR